MMPDLNWWLMALAFLLGLLLTFAMMIRRVTREVPTGFAPAAADSIIEESPTSETGTETGTGAGTEAEKRRRS
jgi:hypothetical protein